MVLWLETNGLKFLHVSQNSFKKYDDGTEVVMLTYRTYHSNLDEFDDVVATTETALNKKFNIEGRIHKEFSIYDTKVSHDAEWVKK